MIEALVDYIEQKGYTVRVQRWTIFIEKQVGSHLVCYGWAIDPWELHHRLPSESWFSDADTICDELEQSFNRGTTTT